jgi:2-keto-4-pentenoate hydratase/2-oxohepta-3-ene-1,7-dioic acid hydratase in catechol pathway
MKLRRMLRADSPQPQLQCAAGRHWSDLSAQAIEADRLGWLPTSAGHSGVASNEASVCLPFQPLSFRDCMLFEDHWVQSSRGYAKHFLPWTRPFTQAFEAITRQTFPAFRPGKLWSQQPIYYFGNHLSFVVSGTPVAIPDYTRALDYELELGWVLSKPLFNATPDEALDAIGGFVVVNDFSARDVQRAEMQTGLGPQKSKHFLSSMSDTLVTADEVLPWVGQLKAHVELNGKCVAKTNTQGMRYHPGEVLAHLSRCERLYPGELIASGTLPNGCGMEIGRLLQAGDQLHMVIEGVGEITHTIG